MTSVSYTLSANVEAMYLTGSGLTGTGNSGANTLVTIGANTLVGGGGNDTFVFFAGSANGATVADFDREGDRVGFPGVQRLRHRGAGRDLHARSAPPTSGRSIPASMPTTRRSRSRTTPRCMPGISCSCEAAPAQRPYARGVAHAHATRCARSVGGRVELQSMTAPRPDRLRWQRSRLEPRKASSATLSLFHPRRT